MKAILLAALVAGAPTLAAAQQPLGAPPPIVGKAEPGESAANKAEDMDLAAMMAMFEKIFPPQPDPQPARLALARATAAGVLPDGTYAALFDEMMGGMVDRFLSMSEADFEQKDGKGKPAGSATLRQELAKDDPHFEERMRITRRVVGEELTKISALMEPKLRDGLARAIARRFDERQLGEINAFLATETGRAFGGQSMRMWVDPDVMRSMLQSFPDMITAMPGAIKRLESETAHLPKPPKKQGKAGADEADEADEPEQEEEAEEAELPSA